MRPLWDGLGGVGVGGGCVAPRRDESVPYFVLGFSLVPACLAFYIPLSGGVSVF